MEYLKRVLGIEVLYENKALEHLPNFINTRYVSQRVFLNGQKVVFLYPKNELEQVETLKKHLERVKKSADCPVVLVLEQITARQREYLLREKVAFIVDGKQIYLPFMAVYLQERCDAEKSDREEILPSAQMLLLYFIYEGAKELSTSQAAKDLELTPTSISRASKQLEERGLLQAKKIGVQKILSSENSPKELFYKAEKALLSPVKRTVYNHSQNALSCRYNMDTNRVEAQFNDGTILSIDCIAVEDEYGNTPAQRAELDWLLYNKPLEYARLVLGAEIEHYLSLGCNHGRLED